MLIAALRHAHSMETGALEVLERQASRLEPHPEFQGMILLHLANTERQLERLEKCLDALGEDVGRQPPASAWGTGAPPGGDLISDLCAAFAFEHYEIAAYRSLLTLCEMAIQRSIAPLLVESLEEEEAMARWLKDSLSRMIKTFVVADGKARTG